MSVLISAVLLWRQVQSIDSNDLLKSFDKICPQTKFTFDKGSDSIIMLNCDGCTVAIAPMPAPYPWSDLEGPCNTSLLWPEATVDLKDHKGHILVTCLSKNHNEFEMNSILSNATAATVDSVNESLGVYWGNSTSVIRKDIYVDMIKEILPFGPPVMIWIDIRIWKNENGTTSAFTTGLKALGHMEIETINFPLGPGELREQFWSFAEYLIQNGPVVMDGNTIGGSANEKILVKHDVSKFGIDGKVMRLIYSE